MHLRALLDNEQAVCESLMWLCCIDADGIQQPHKHITFLALILTDAIFDGKRPDEHWFDPSSLPECGRWGSWADIKRMIADLVVDGLVRTRPGHEQFIGGETSIEVQLTLAGRWSREWTNARMMAWTYQQWGPIEDVPPAGADE